MQPVSKLPHIGTTIFTIMSKMATDEGAINLSQGFPGFGADPVLLELVANYTKNGFNQYSPMSGIPGLRAVLAEKTKITQGYLPNSEDEVTIVSGATEAIFCAVTAIIEEGDEVIVLEPAYDSYEPAITSGYVWTEEDVDTLAELVQDTGIYIISDEVYEHITFDNRPHFSLGAHQDLRDRTFVCGSFGKTFHVTGWKIGYCIAPKPLTLEFRRIHQYVTFSTVTPIQFALAEYLEVPDRYLSIPAFYERKRNVFAEGLKQTELEFIPSQGSFFQVARYGHLSKISDRLLAERMTKELKVACIPVSVFYSTKKDDHLIRFCFAKEESELQEALERLKNLQNLWL